MKWRYAVEYSAVLVKDVSVDADSLEDANAMISEYIRCGHFGDFVNEEGEKSCAGDIRGLFHEGALVCNMESSPRDEVWRKYVGV